jgi:hypothetical protein
MTKVLEKVPSFDLCPYLHRGSSNEFLLYSQSVHKEGNTDGLKQVDGIVLSDGLMLNERLLLGTDELEGITDIDGVFVS